MSSGVGCWCNLKEKNTPVATLSQPREFYGHIEVVCFVSSQATWHTKLLAMISTVNPIRPSTQARSSDAIRLDVRRRRVPEYQQPCVSILSPIPEDSIYIDHDQKKSQRNVGLPAELIKAMYRFQPACPIKRESINPIDEGVSETQREEVKKMLLPPELLKVMAQLGQQRQSPGLEQRRSSAGSAA